MGVETVTTERVSPVETKRLWKATVKDGHKLMPTILPDVFSEITLSNGDGAPGTIRHIVFGPKGMKDVGYVKEKIEEVDEEKMVYKYSLVEGGLLGTAMKSARFELKFEPKEGGGGGSVVKTKLEYELVEGVSPDPSKLKEFEDGSQALAQVVDGFLSSHPELYA